MASGVDQESRSLILPLYDKKNGNNRVKTPSRGGMGRALADSLEQTRHLGFSGEASFHASITWSLSVLSRKSCSVRMTARRAYSIGGAIFVGQLTALAREGIPLCPRLVWLHTRED